MKEKKYNFFIIIGAILILIRLIDYNRDWSILDWIKIILGVFLIIYGINKRKMKN